MPKALILVGGYGTRCGAIPGVWRSCLSGVSRKPAAAQAA